jgi:hypothetical protein
MDVKPFLAAVALVNRACEFVKPVIRTWNVKREIQDAILMAIAALVGVMVCLISELNLLGGLVENRVIGIVMTGFVVSIGADFVNLIFDLLYAGRDVIRARAYVHYQQGDLVLLSHADEPDEHKKVA